MDCNIFRKFHYELIIVARKQQKTLVHKHFYSLLQKSCPMYSHGAALVRRTNITHRHTDTQTHRHIPKTRGKHRVGLSDWTN